MSLIYRGVSFDYDSKARAMIQAKGEGDELVFMAGDDRVMTGNTLNTMEASRRNAMHGHNICSDLYKTSFVSFTTDLKIAEKFATDAGFSNGYIYVVKTSILDELGITYMSQGAEANEGEREVLVNLSGRDHLPELAIIEKRVVRGVFC